MEGFKTINGFLIRIFALYLFWFISDEYLSHNFLFYNKVWTFFYHILILGSNNSAAFLLNLAGYDIVHNYRSIAVVGSYGVTMGNYCAGFGLIYACFSLFISYPAPIKPKLWFVPSAVFFIFLCNVGRVIYLTLLTYKTPQVNFNDQHNLFNNFIYIVFFVLWIIWIKFVVPERKLLASSNKTNS